MRMTGAVKAAIIVALVAAAAMTPHQSSAGWTALALVAFGVLNVLIATPGTAWVRAAAVLATFAGLLWPIDARLSARLMILFWGCLAWPVGFLFAWWVNAVELRRETPQPDVEPIPMARGRQSRIVVAAIIAGVAVAALAYRVILGHGLQQTAALFVGIPALLAMVAVFGATPRSATGVACKAVTVGLLVSMMFLGEGMLCIAMSAPLFYAIAVIVGASIDRLRRGSDRDGQRVFSCLALLALIPMSWEGVTSVTSFNHEEWVSATRVVRASAGDVERALFETPRFERALPLYLRAGFPRPTTTRIEHGAAGSRWVIRVRGGEMRLNGMEPRAGDLVLELEEARPGFVRWRAVMDDSHMTHFLSWRESLVQWEAIDARTTKVTWSLHYRRGLDPAWYFGPWERYAAGLAAGYLIDAVATP